MANWGIVLILYYQVILRGYQILHIRVLLSQLVKIHPR